MKSRHLRAAAFGLALVSGSAPFLLRPVAAQAQPQTPIPTLSDSPQRALVNRAFLDDISGWELLAGSTLSRIEGIALPPDEAGGIGRALRLDVKSPAGAENYTVQLRQEIGVAVAENQRLRLSFWARSPQSARLNAVVEDKTTYAKILEKSVQLSPQWTQYQIDGTSAAAFSARSLTVNFQLGGATAVTELADIKLEDPARPLAANLQLQPTERGSLQNPLSLLKGDADLSTGWQASRAQSSRFTARLAGAAVPAARLEIPAKTDNDWEAKFATPNPRPLVGGDTIAMRAWARSATGNTAKFVFQKSSGDYQKFISQAVALTPDWKEYRFVGKLDGTAGLGANESNFEVHVGAGQGTVELAAIRVDSYGAAPRADVIRLVGGETVDYYGGRENSRDWVAPALARIEKIRKAPLRVRVVDNRGKPVKEAQVNVTMTRPSFRWGTAAPASLMADYNDADAIKFQQVLKRYFNTVTFENDLKWRDTSPLDQATIDRAFAWLAANDIDVRGHNLVWGSLKFLPKNFDGKAAQELTDAEWKTLIATRIEKQAGRYKGQVYAWDVVNEAVSEHDLWDKIGWDNFVETFRQARRADPDALLSYNDYFAVNRMDESAQWKRERAIIRMLLDAKVPLDTIGEQAHLGTPLIPMKQMLSNLDDIAQLGKPIEITEFDVGLPDDEANARYVRDFLTAAYSHPKVESIIQWGFWQGAHWRAGEGAGLYERDWTPRAAAKVYEDLVLNQWWTREKGATDKAGRYAVRGFLGDYTVTANSQGKTGVATVKLDKNSRELVVVIR